MPATRAIDDLEALRQRAAELQARADAEALRYRHGTWKRWVGVVFPIPFVVVLLRLYFDAWAYYVAGGALVVSTMVLFELDTAARDRSNAAEQAAEAAQRDYQAALAARQPGAPMLC
ncbi:MAG: hypothetical protein U1E21_19505 [Reyranellaceae bacterium]